MYLKLKKVKLWYLSLILGLMFSLTACSASEISQIRKQREQRRAEFFSSWFDRKHNSQINKYSKNRHNNNAEYYLKLANKNKTAQKYNYQIVASDELIKANNLIQAEKILNSIPKTNLNTKEIQDLNLKFAELKLKQKNPKEALSFLNKIPSLEKLSGEKYLLYLGLKAKAFEQNKQFPESIKTNLELRNYTANSTEQKHINNKIWYLVNTMPIVEIYKNYQNQSEIKSNPEYQGWIDLAYINSKFQTNPIRMQHAIRDWHISYQGHPGTSLMPSSEHQNIVNHTKPQRIALLLPMQGTNSASAQAVYDGFIANYYIQNQAQSIKLYDTNEDKDTIAAYKTAIKDKADIIIGPLTKKGIDELNRISLSVPVVALNTISNAAHKANLYQFGLIPELEVAAIVQKAKNNGYRKAIILAIANKQGERLANSFENQWRKKNGKIVEKIFIKPNQNLNNIIKELLQVSKSQERSNELQKIVGNQIKISSRQQRRQDIDMIFIAMPAATARQVKPLLNFYYAKDLPVITTSSIFSGKIDPKKDRDLDDIEFCDMPWMISSSNEIKQIRNKIIENMPNSAINSPRLFALGIDAYDLANQINYLSAYGQKTHNGVTGEISVDDLHRVIRIPEFAKFKEGKPVSIPNAL